MRLVERLLRLLESFMLLPERLLRLLELVVLFFLALALSCSLLLLPFASSERLLRLFESLVPLVERLLRLPESFLRLLEPATCTICGV